MDWPTIHRYAEEAELWTTLAINCWLILTAVALAIGRLFRVAVPFVTQFFWTSIWSLITLTATVFLAAPYVLFAAPNSPWIPIVLVFGTVGALAATLLNRQKI